MNPITIIGSGLSGLIMAEVLSANGFKYRIIEKKVKKEFKTTKHIYYLHSNNVEKIIPIPLKKMIVEKHWFNSFNQSFQYSVNLHDLFDYSNRYSKMIANSSVEECGQKFVGYIENYNLSLHQILIDRHYDKIEFGAEDYNFGKDNVVVNTSSIKSVSRWVEVKDDQFQLGQERVIKLEVNNINMDKIIIIHSSNLFKRITVFSNIIIMEGINNKDDEELSLKYVFKYFNKSNIVNREEYSVPVFNKIDDVLRKNILFRLTSEKGIYSLGRLATWSYKRIDHVVDDALDIVKMIRFSQMGRW